MYSLFGYRRMAADRLRMAAYAQAMRSVIRPGAIVLDIGTGTGACAILACRYGAGKVIAIEPDVAIEGARANAQANGVADRIEFIRKPSQEVTLVEPADVLVADLRGVLPFFTRNIPAIVDARTRLLAPDGAMVLARDRLWAAVVESESIYEVHEGIVLEQESVDLQAVSRYTRNLTRRVSLAAETLITEPVAWAEVDYRTVVSPNVHARLRAVALRAGTGHGIGIWFDAELAGGASMRNAPGEPELVYGQLFFPWQEPVVLETGDIIDVVLRADLVGDEYIWTWQSTISAEGAPAPRAQFHQSTFFSLPLTLDSMARLKPDYVPVLNSDGVVDMAVLAQMDGHTTKDTIAASLQKSFPDRFPSHQDALNRVIAVAQKYGA